MWEGEPVVESKRSRSGLERRVNCFDERQVVGMAGFRRGYMRMQRTAEQVEIADQIEHLVAREFVVEAQSGVHDFVVIDEDCVVEAGAAAKAEFVELAELADGAEGARRCDLARVRVGRSQLEVQLLNADRFRVFERVVNDQMAGGFGLYELEALAFL